MKYKSIVIFVSCACLASFAIATAKSDSFSLLATATEQQEVVTKPSPALPGEGIDQEFNDTFLKLIEEDPSFKEEDLFEEEAKKKKEETPSEFYKISMGDSFYISVYGEPNTGRSVTVDYTGSIYYLAMEPIFVLGKTIPELREILNERLSALFKYVNVTITPLQFGSKFYTIMGEVGTPGKKVLQGKPTVLTAICQSGGLRTGAFRSQTIDFADLHHTFLARKGDYVPIDFYKLILQGDLSQDVPLESGDYIFVPSILNREIYVLGEVNISTTIGYLHTMSIIEAIAEARGITPIASSRAIVIRGALVNPVQYQVDIWRIFRGFEPNFILQPGDIVYVPPRRFENLKLEAQNAIASFVSSAVTFGAGKYFQEVVRDASPAHMALEARRDAEE